MKNIENITIEIDEQDMKAKPDATRLYLKQAKAMLALQEADRDLEELKKAEGAMLQCTSNIAGRVTKEAVANRLSGAMHEALGKVDDEINRVYYRQAELKDGMKDNLELMAKKGIPWLNRSVTVQVREIFPMDQDNRFLEHVGEGVDTHARVRTDALIEEVKKDLLKYLSPNEFYVVPQDLEVEYDTRNPARANGAVIAFPETLEDKMRMILPNVIKDRLARLSGAGGMEVESFEDLSEFTDQFSEADVVKKLEYNFVTRSTSSYRGGITNKLLGGHPSNWIRDLKFDRAYLHFVPKSMADTPEVKALKLEEQIGWGNTDVREKVESKMAKAFVEHMDKRLKPAAKSELSR